MRPGGFAALIPYVNPDGTTSNAQANGTIVENAVGLDFKGKMSGPANKQMPFERLFVGYDPHELRAQDASGTLTTYCHK